jgi:hypothetical protein
MDGPMDCPQADELWCRVTVVAADGTQVAGSTLRGPGQPDLRTVDVLARLALDARRLDARVVLAEVTPALVELLALAGLVVEVAGEAERREQALGVEEVEEELHPDDPTA